VLALISVTPSKLPGCRSSAAVTVGTSPGSVVYSPCAYSPLCRTSESFGAYANPLQSLWLVRTSKTPSQVRDELRSKVDTNDEVLVFDVTGDPWASNFDDPHIQWMLNNMGISRAA
jgi:hypothetical protein